MERRCLACARVLAATAPEGLCVSCLFQTVLETPEIPDEEESSVHDLTSPDALLEQRQFAGYELIEELGRGGMGVVFRAYQRKLGRTVALKVIAAGELASSTARSRFRREAEAAAALDHPHIVPIFDIGEHAGWPYFSMRLIEGPTLARSALDPGFSPRQAAELTVTLSRALHHAHQRGVLHRDLKPENVILDADGRPHLSDFGLARRLTDERLTQSLVVLGTPGFLAPEQAAGDWTRITTATDIHGLGAILFFLLTQRPPFEGKTTGETLSRVLAHEPPPLRSLLPEIHPDLATICETCLRKDPKRRYASAEAMAQDLDRWLRGEPIAARPSTTWERARLWVVRRPVLAASLALLFLGLTGTILLLTTTNRSIQNARRLAEDRAEENRKRRVDLNVILGNQLAAAGESHTALLRFLDALELTQGDAASEDIHRRRYASMLRGGASLDQTWFFEGTVHDIAFSLDGKQLFTCSDQGAIHVWDIATGEPVGPPLQTEVQPYRIAVDRSGNRVFFLDNEHRVHRWDRAAQSSTLFPQTLKSSPEAMTSTADRRWLLVALDEGVQVFNATTDEPVGPLIEGSKGTHQIFASRKANRVAGVSPSNEVRAWEIPDGTPLGPPIRVPGRIKQISLDPAGEYLAVAYGDSQESVATWDLRTGNIQLSPRKPGGDIYDLEHSPDGKRLVTASWDGDARILDAQTGSQVGDSIVHRRGIGRTLFSQDGTRIASISWDKTARISDSKTGRPLSPTLHHAGYLTGFAFHPSGTVLATASADKTVRLWRLGSIASELQILRHSPGILRGGFSPDGSTIRTAAVSEPSARLFDSRSATVRHVWPHPKPCLLARFDPTGSRIVTACQDGYVRVFDTLSGQRCGPEMKHGSPVMTAAFSPDGSLILSGGSDGSIRIWRAHDGNLLVQCAAHAASILHAQFSPDGSRFVTGSQDQSARVWDTVSASPVSPRLAHPFPLWTANFSPDGRHILTAGTDPSQLPRAAQIWDAVSGDPVSPPLFHKDGVIHATYSSDGRLVASSGEDTVTRIWEAKTGQPIAPPLVHRSYVMHSAFSPNNRLILTSSSDTTARVWDVQDGQPVTPPLQHGAEVMSGSWSPDGLRVLTFAIDGTARIWDLSPAQGSLEALRRQAEILAAQRLDPVLGLVDLDGTELRFRAKANATGSPKTPAQIEAATMPGSASDASAR